MGGPAGRAAEAVVTGRGAPWLLVEAGKLAGETSVRLDPEESGHLVRSLRRRAGDRVTLTDGAGTVAEGVVRDHAAGAAVVDLEAVRVVPEPVEEGVTLALAVLHGQAMDWAVQKAVELGARRLVPVLTERSQLGSRAVRGRNPHWHRVARAALKQCHRAWAMEIRDPLALAELARLEGGVLAHPEGDLVGELPAGRGNLLLVGPEGGLSAGEQGLLEAAGWWRLRLGPHTLRAETAAVVGVALLINR
jgi:16S rRNA (uracil1498-N3)-methyltransferase